MKPLRLSILVLACAFGPACLAQWQWVDKGGRKVFSDHPPPSNILDKDVVTRPATRTLLEAPKPAPVPAPETTPDGAASAPKVSGRDKELEEKKKQLQAADAEKKKAQEDEISKLRAENCERFRRSKLLLESGSRIWTTNARGEREVMDDAARSAEGKRLDSAMARDCKPG